MNISRVDVFPAKVNKDNLIALCTVIMEDDNHLKVRIYDEQKVVFPLTEYANSLSTADKSIIAKRVLREYYLV